MTPKGRMTPKNDRSGLKTKGDLTAKKEKDGKDTSTVKKRIVKEPLQLDEQRHDKFKLYWLPLKIQ